MLRSKDNDDLLFSDRHRCGFDMFKKEMTSLSQMLEDQLTGNVFFVFYSKHICSVVTCALFFFFARKTNLEPKGRKDYFWFLAKAVMSVFLL